MIQVIREAPRRPNKGAMIGDALGKALIGGLQIYGEHQKKKQEEQQYQEENETYSQLTGRNLSKNPRIRELEILHALKGENEGIKYKNKDEERAAKLRGEQNIQKELVSFADRLESRDPKFKGIADIYRLDIPLDQKSKIVQSITGTDVYREDQQKRLQLDSVLKRYNSRLKEIDNEITNVRNPNSTGKEEVDGLRRQRMSLRNERDQLLDFRSLNGMDESFDDEEEIESEDEDEEGPKVAFNPNNKNHRAVAEKLYKKYKDKEKVRSILRNQFKGL